MLALQDFATAGAGVSFSRSQTDRTSLRRRPSISRCTSSSSSSTADKSLRAAFEPPEIRGRW